ncbi:MAG TPA: septum formation initiator family protein [Bacillota bacterium]|jgi:cell division protein FtsB|nr:hypothetical protein [Candidatus Fermentithermobacillaceae bacterium]HOB29909.1 septum formation initiator family protein [Bacillota bacterium]HOK63779.1 septum formation initiator family protein [Bacillota bacterium]HOL11533.1 septum formation initiator family protein [Bacillota bacterium]HOQ02590.1 septum formation initiator family protein [Bacillota bacterium]
MIKDFEIDSRKSVPVEVFGILYFGLLVIIGIALVWQPAKVATMNQELMALEATLQDLKMRNEDLKRIVATMESLAFIEAQARDVLGMVDPEQVRAIAVNLQDTEILNEPGSEHVAVSEPEQTGIVAWFSRIVEFMRDNLTAAKERR